MPKLALSTTNILTVFQTHNHRRTTNPIAEMSSNENTPKRTGKQYRFNPKEPRAYELLTKHIAAKAKRSIKEKDNLGKIVATIAKGKHVSTYNHAVSGIFTIDLSEFFNNLQKEINDSILANTNEEDVEAKVTSSKVEFRKAIDGKESTIQIRTTIVYESDTAAPIDTLARNLKQDTDVTTKMSVKYRTGVSTTDSKAYEFEELKMKTKSQTVCCATRESLVKADDKLEGMVYDCLDDELKRKLDEHFEELEKDDEDTSQPGKISLEYLNQKFGLDKNGVIEMVDRYMEYLATTKTSDQNLYQYADKLKKKLDSLHDANWSMNNLYLVLILAHAMKSSDVDDRGDKIDYSRISDMITASLNAATKLKPIQIVNALEKDAKMAKSALKLVTQGTAAEALRATMHTNNADFDRQPPSGFGFGKIPTALWCAYCAKSNKHEQEGWEGWNQQSITKCKAHTRPKCPFERRTKGKGNNKRKDKANKENQTGMKSLEARMAELTAIVASLAEQK